MKKEEFLAMSLPFDLMIAEINDDGLIVRKSMLCQSRYHDFATHDYYKPILRQLSDLTKPIEHNGEKFVPIEKIAYSYGYEIRISRNKLLQPIMCEQFNVVLQLVEWHFDIAGLIEKGEAIDVNTLPENPYK